MDFMLEFLLTFFDLSILDKFLLISAFCFWMFPLVFMLRSRVQLKRNNNEIDNKISVLEDICDRADIRISKLKHELNQLGSSEGQAKREKTSEFGVPTYQEVVKRIQDGKTIEETSQETGVSVAEIKVLYKLIEASIESQS